VLSKVLSSAVIGIDACLVEVEVDIAFGLPSYTTVGLPEISVRESKERVKAAIANSGYVFPDDRIIVNLAPAHIRKMGTGFDLPIALGILSASGVIPSNALEGRLVLGELSLDGRVKPVNGSLPMALAARDAGYTEIIVPHANRREAAVVGEISVIAVQTLSEAVDFIRGALGVVPERFDPDLLFSGDEGNVPDFSEVAGQEHVKRAMEIAAAGGHNLLMAGPPGSGKTMMARRFAGILPDLTFEESLETTKIFSVAGLLDKEQALVTRRPFRSPHHTISDAGMIGGGNIPRPGEISLAHNGVLFMDELPEFRRPVLEALRQPLEDRKVTISRAAMSITYPSCFILVAAMNPCPCGYLTDHKMPCRCSHYQLQKYRDRISGPLLDRIDIHVDVPAVGYGDLTHPRPGEASGRIRKRVSAARKTQTARFCKTGIHNNAGMKNRHIKIFCRIDDDSGRLLQTAIDTLGLSARAYNRILKIARTIADLAGETDIRSPDVAEAIQYRSLDRKP
jgi:magnesium chelatase family protein